MDSAGDGRFSCRHLAWRRPLCLNEEKKSQISFHGQKEHWTLILKYEKGKPVWYAAANYPLTRDE